MVRGMAMAKGPAPTDWLSTLVVDVPYDLSLMREYMEQPGSVIVVVFASKEPKPEALLKLVAEIDPKYERTVCVYSKIDRLPIKGYASFPPRLFTPPSIQSNWFFEAYRIYGGATILRAPLKKKCFVL